MSKQPFNRLPKISDELRAFIESDYKGMVSYENREREGKKLHKTAKETRKKQLSRGLKKDLDILGLAKKKKWLSDNQYQIEKNKLLDEAEQKKLNHRNEDKEHIKPFGKTHYGFNNFVCLSWYLIKKETDRPDSNIFGWISNFLNENNFRKQNNKQYNETDLRRIIYNHNYGNESSGKSYMESYFDFMYSEFIQK